jgi:hypothetical protein
MDVMLMMCFSTCVTDEDWYVVGALSVKKANAWHQEDRPSNKYIFQKMHAGLTGRVVS